MRKIGNLLKDLLQDDDGQVLVEYLLMAAVVVAVIGVIGTGFRRILITLWERMARDIAAPCPGCEPPPNAHIR